MSDELFIKKHSKNKIVYKEPVLIDDNTNLEQYIQQKQKIKFICKNCKKEEINLLQSFLRRKKINFENLFLCKQCSYEKTCLEKYGVKNTDYIKDGGEKRIKIYQKEPIEICYNEDLNKFKKSQKLKFICKQCNNESIQLASTLRKNNTFICSICNLNNTILKKYNVKNIMHVHDFFIKGCKFYCYNNVMFDSSWELAYYIWLKDNNINFEYQPNISFDYEYNNKIHKYKPDFKVNNEIIEIKGDQFIKNGKMVCPYNHDRDELFNEKYKCMLKHNVKILMNKDIKPIIKYIKEKYGKNYLKNFIVNKN